MDIKDVRKKLPRGSVKVIAEKLKISPQYVSAIFHGKIVDSKHHEKILAKALDILEARAAKHERLQAVMGKFEDYPDVENSASRL